MFYVREVFHLLFILSALSGIYIVSLNINAARKYRKRVELYELFKQKRVNVAMLQEIHSDVSNQVRE